MSSDSDLSKAEQERRKRRRRRRKREQREAAAVSGTAASEHDSLRHHRMVAAAATLTILGIALAGVGDSTFGAMLVVAGMLALFYAIHRFGRLGPETATPIGRTRR